MIQNRTYMNPRSSREQNLSRQIADFLSGRYGFDILSLFLIELLVILVLINRLALKFAPLDHLLALIVLVVLFRAFSYNTRARKAEGDKFLSLLGPHSLWITNPLAAVKELSSYKHLSCPQCHGHARVPRKCGHIRVTCPHCNKTFEADS